MIDSGRTCFYCKVVAAGELPLCANAVDFRVDEKGRLRSGRTQAVRAHIVCFERAHQDKLAAADKEL
jgi:hypothetical protein